MREREHRLFGEITRGKERDRAHQLCRHSIRNRASTIQRPRIRERERESTTTTCTKSMRESIDYIDKENQGERKRVSTINYLEKERERERESIDFLDKKNQRGIVNNFHKEHWRKRESIDHWDKDEQTKGIDHWEKKHRTLGCHFLSTDCETWNVGYGLCCTYVILHVHTFTSKNVYMHTWVT